MRKYSRRNDQKGYVKENSINDSMKFNRDHAKHGTMSRRIARNQVIGRFIFGDV